jgi:hypothetical protein
MAPGHSFVGVDYSYGYYDGRNGISRSSIGTKEFHCGTQKGTNQVASPLTRTCPLQLSAWFAAYIEDFITPRNPPALAVFQQRFVSGQPQLDPVLDHFADHLRQIWRHYPPFTANIMVNSALDFVGGCYFEVITNGMRIHQTAYRYPDWIRGKTSLADLFILFLWPASQFPEISAYIQAAPSVSHFFSQYSPYGPFNYTVKLMLIYLCIRHFKRYSEFLQGGVGPRNLELCPSSCSNGGWTGPDAGITGPGK